jgi:hypothetical protein
LEVFEDSLRSEGVGGNEDGLVRARPLLLIQVFPGQKGCFAGLGDGIDQITPRRAGQNRLLLLGKLGHD